MNTSTIQLLLIEDNPADALLVREMLNAAQHMGWDLPRCELKHMARLQEGMDCLENETFDVILSDLDLPDSRAEDTVATLREHVPQMPLVVLTGREDEALARKSVRAGVQDYLYKNEATGSLLIRAIMYAIERQQIHGELEQRVEERTAELRQANEELQDSEAELAAIIESAPFVMMVVDRERRIRKINHSGTEFAGRSPEEMLGLRGGEALRCIHALDDPRGCGFGSACQDCAVRRTVLDTLETGESHHNVEVTMTFNRQDGEEERSLLVYASPFTTSGERRALVVFLDITERKQMEEALKRRAEDLKAINELAIKLITAPSSADHLELIADVLKNITHALAVVASVYDPEQQALTVKYIAAKGERIARMTELLGRRVEGFSMPVSDELYAQITQEVERKVPDLHAATLGTIPKPVSTAAQRAFGIDHCIILTFTDQDELWGSAVIVMPEGQTSSSNEVMEIFARVTAASLRQRQAEDALLKSEERFRLIAESSSDVIFQLDLAGRVTYCSPAAERILGFAPNEVTGAHLTRFFPKSGQTEALHNFDQVIAKECGVTLETEIIDHTGAPVPIEATLAPIKNHGHVVGVQGHARDVTERKQMEKEIEGERAFLAAVIDNIEEATVICDAEGRIIRFNEAARRLHGLPERPIPPDQWAEHYDLYREDGTTPLSTEEIPLFRALQGERVRDAEIVVNPKHGKPRSLVCNGQILTGESGQVSGAVVTMHDITERKQMEETLHWKSEAESAIAALSTDLLESASIDELSHRVLEHTQRLTGSAFGYVGYIDQETGYLICPTMTRDIWDDCQVPGKDFVFEEFGGLWGWVLESREPLLTNALQDDPRSSGVPEGHLPIRRFLSAPAIIGDELVGQIALANPEEDYTERELVLIERMAALYALALQRQQAEEEIEHYATELERSNEELEQFAYVISHDLQEPARMVKSYLELLENYYQGKLDEKADMFIEHAVDGAERMQEMIRALLNLSRVKTWGKDTVPTDAEEVLKRVLRSLERAIEEAEAEVTHDSLPTVMADEAQLAQVFQNLIANAIKFRREDVPPHVHISAEREGDAWLFSVADNGIGIDPGQADRLFQIFQRLHTREEYEGLGIGLALCKRIVERHGGRIWVESTPGNGTTFLFTLPASRKL